LYLVIEALADYALTKSNDLKGSRKKALKVLNLLEARTGIEPMSTDLQSAA
tara:strand:+ start:1588 stop:1740 length:153 start_codon:yes stop_codon:yes gene_type:complete